MSTSEVQLHYPKRCNACTHAYAKASMHSVMLLWPLEHVEMVVVSICLGHISQTPTRHVIYKGVGCCLQCRSPQSLTGSGGGAGSSNRNAPIPCYSSRVSIGSSNRIAAWTRGSIGVSLRFGNGNAAIAGDGVRVGLRPGNRNAAWPRNGIGVGLGGSKGNAAGASEGIGVGHRVGNGNAARASERVGVGHRLGDCQRAAPPTQKASPGRNQNRGGILVQAVYA